MTMLMTIDKINIHEHNMRKRNLIIYLDIYNKYMYSTANNENTIGHVTEIFDNTVVNFNIRIINKLIVYYNLTGVTRQTFFHIILQYLHWYYISFRPHIQEQ